MENKETSETLEEGFMLSKLSQVEIPCNKILGEGNSVCLNNLNEEFAADLYSLDSEINHVELASKFGNGSVEESMVFDGIGENNLMNKGSLSNYPEDKLSVSTRANDINDNNVAVLEGNLEFSGNVGVWIGNVDEPFNKCDDTLRSHELFKLEKVDEATEKGDHMLRPQEPGSPTKIEVSGNSINLFVEVFGPLNGISENSKNLDDTKEVEHKLGESESSQEFSLKENGTISPSGIKEESCKNEGEDIVGEHECTFSSGDLVWVKTRTEIWWPGMISGPPTAVNDATKSEKRVNFLVKYYGNPSFLWCDQSELKPFVEYFEQMSGGQNNSRTFCASVERALCEIGLRVKSKMTCPCFTKDAQTLDAQWTAENKVENSMSADKDRKLGVLSLSEFEPTTFYAFIKHLARSIYAPGQIELTIVKNRLSSFYCSVGHCELPLQLLRSEVTDEDHDNISGDSKKSVEVHGGDVTGARRKKRNRGDDGDLVHDETASSAKGLESRERKKSKYLSYPYINVNQGLNVASTVEQEKEDPNCPSSLNTKSTPLPSCSGMKSRKKWTKKPLKRRHIVSKADDIDACSAELLAELCSTARDGFSFGGSKYSGSLKRFYSSFRMFTFLDVDIACKNAGDQQPPNLEKCLKNFSKAVKKDGIKVVKKLKNKSMNLASAEESVENVVGRKSPNTENVEKRAKKKKEHVTNTQNQTERIRVVKEAENHKVKNASSEGSGENAVGDKFSNTDNLQAKENVVCSKAKQKKEQVISSGLESIQNSFRMGTNIFPNSSGMISFQQARSNVPGVIPGAAHTNSIARLPDLNGTHPSFLVEHISVGELSTELAKPLPEQRKECFSSPNIDGVNQMVFTSVSSPKDAPVTLQNTPQENYSMSGPNQCRNEDFTAVESSSNVTNMGLSPFAHYALKMGIFGSAGKPEPKKRKRKEKTAQAASAIPDLNGNVLDMSSSGITMPEGSHISVEGEPPKRRVSKSDLGPNGEPLGGNLLLNFATGSTLPSKETLVATFSRYGLLKESELQVLSDSSIQIAYERRSDARFAFRSLEKSHSFGESLVSFKTDCMPHPSSIKKKNMKILRTSVPMDASKNQTKPNETPDIALIKQNVEMMKLTLEKTGDNLSPEVRAKLENEIKAFLDKISSMTGSCPS